jgi:short coiled-coil protein
MQQIASSGFPTVAEPAVCPSSASDNDGMSSSSSSSGSVSEDGAKPDTTKLQRPKLGSRKSSGTIIIPRDSPHVELKEEEYDDGDARTMSPRRSSEEIEKMGQEARLALIE